MLLRIRNAGRVVKITRKIKMNVKPFSQNKRLLDIANAS